MAVGLCANGKENADGMLVAVNGCDMGSPGVAVQVTDVVQGAHVPLHVDGALHLGTWDELLMTAL